MVVRRKVASAYEDGAKKRVKQYGIIIGVCLVVIYCLSGSRKEDEVLNDIKPMNVRSKSKMNSFSGPYANVNNQQQLERPPPPQQPLQYQNQQPPPLPPMQQQPFMNQQEQPQQQMLEPPPVVVPPPATPNESVVESVKGAQIDIENVARKESMKGQEELLEKTLEAASESLKKHPIENNDIDPNSIESAVALRLEEKVSSKLAKVTDNLIEEKELSLNEIVDEDKAEGLDSNKIKEDVAAMEEMSIKELKEGISDEVHNLEKNLQEEANKIEDQVLQERLDRIQKQVDESEKFDETEEEDDEEDETEEDEKAEEVIDEKDLVAKVIKSKEEQKDPSKIISLSDEVEESANIVPNQEEETAKKVIDLNIENENGEGISATNIMSNHEEEQEKVKKAIDLNVENENEDVKTISTASIESDHEEKEEKVIDLNIENENEKGEKKYIRKEMKDKDKEG